MPWTPAPPHPPMLSTLISSSQACIYLVPSTELSTQQAFPKQPGHINHPSLPGKGHLLQSHPRVTRQPCTGSAEETHKNLWNEFISLREFLPVRVGAKVDDLGRGAGPWTHVPFSMFDTSSLFFEILNNFYQRASCFHFAPSTNLLLTDDPAKLWQLRAYI